AFPDPFNLSLPDHVHDLIPSDGPPRRVETEEAEPGIDPALCRVGRQRVVLADTFLSAPLRTMRDRFRRALDSGGSCGNKCCVPSHDPPESNACMLNLCRRRFKVTPAYPRDAWNKGGGNLF